MKKVDHLVLEFNQGKVIHLLGQGLSKIIKTYQVHFEFHALPVFWPNVNVGMLDIRHGEALVVKKIYNSIIYLNRV